jgi:hypothetical protein
MGLFDGGQSLTSTIGAGGGLIGAVSSAASPDGLMSAIRSGNLPAAGEAVGDILGAVAEFSSNDSPDDWRVRLSIAKWSSFRSSPVLKPLNDAGALIFPYTPSITISAGSTYKPIDTTHTNYTFNAFKNSDPGIIKITAPMNVEDQTQGLYWIAAVHYLRSLTKMFAGSDPKAGNPPPLVFLNGYGNYIFKNVPVVVKSFTTSLDDKCDYIGVDVVGSAAGAIQGVTDSIGGLADTLGGAIPGLSGITSSVSSVSGGIGQVAGLLGTFGVGGTTSGGVAHVPTKSSFTLELQPMYSRDSARKFSLDRFVTGGYLNNPFGYI